MILLIVLATELTSCGSMQSLNNLFKIKSCGHKHTAAGLGGGGGGEGRGEERGEGEGGRGSVGMLPLETF